MELSVILCVKNGEKYINETVRSILNQTYKNFELMIIVNCSTDNTINIIKRFKDERIKIYETNIGQLSFNLNYGLNIAKGKYIARIDADDIAEKTRFEKQLGILKEKEYDVVGSNIVYIDEVGRVLKNVEFPETNKKIRNKILYKSVIAHPSVIFKKEIVLENNGYLGGKYAQDYDLWLRLMRNKEIKFYNIQEPLLRYRVHREQTKGNRNSYAEVSGYFLKEIFYTKRLIYLISSFIYFVKGMLN